MERQGGGGGLCVRGRATLAPFFFFFLILMNRSLQSGSLNKSARTTSFLLFLNCDNTTVYCVGLLVHHFSPTFCSPQERDGTRREYKLCCRVKALVVMCKWITREMSRYRRDNNNKTVVERCEWASQQEEVGVNKRERPLPSRLQFQIHGAKTAGSTLVLL